MPQQNSITKTFTQAQSRFEVAISFPQGARAVKTKGGDAGKSFGVNIYFTIELQYANETTWNELPPIKFSDIKKDGFILKQTYTGSPGGAISSTNIANCYNSNRAFSVRVKRETSQIVDETIASEQEEANGIRYYYTSTLHSITGFRDAVDPATDPKNTVLAKTALSVLATKQLNGQIDGINAIAQTYTWDWVSTNLSDPNAGSWVMRETSNPAALFVYVLMHPANPQRILQSEVLDKIDRVKIQYWHNYCNQTRTLIRNLGTENQVTLSYKFEYNNVVANVRSVLDLLRDICAAGRASPALVNGKWSVNIDEPKSIVQHFTPHNSWGFESTKTLPKVPDALKIKFYNEEVDYKEDELVVYNYGYGEKDEVIGGQTIKAAELFESINVPGVTNSAQIEDHGKWHFAQIKLRPEVYTFNTDIEYLVCNRGDRVKITHDVPMWGVGSGRIKNRLINREINNSTGQSVSCLELDEEVYIDSSKDYTLRVRRTNLGSSGDGEAAVSTVATLVKTFSIISWSYIGSTVTVNIAADNPLQVNNLINVSGSGPINGSLITITSINQVSGNTQIKYTKPGLTGTGSGTGGTLALATGYYKRIKLVSSLTYTQAAPLDLFLFGELQRESNDLIVLSIEPISGTKNARLTLIDYGVVGTSGTPGYYNIFEQYKDLTRVTYDTLITSINPSFSNLLGNFAPEVIESKIVSDIRAMEVVSPGVYSYGILIPFLAPEGVPESAEYVEAEYYALNSSHIVTTLVPAVATSNGSGSITIKGVEKDRTYKFRLRYVTSSGNYGVWTKKSPTDDWFTHTVTGKLNGPENVENFTLERKETGIYFYWDPCTTPDYTATIIKKTEGTPPANNPTALNQAWESILQDSEGNPLTEKIFEGNTDNWLWIQPEDGTYNFLAKHKDKYGNESSTPVLASLEYDGITIAGIQVELTNDNHQVPTDANGANANLAESGTDIYVYHGATPLIYDTVGTDNGTWKIVSAVGTNLTPGAIDPLVQPTGDGYATINNLQAFAVTDTNNNPVDTGSILFTISGTDRAGNVFTLTKQQKFIKQKDGKNLTLYRIKSSTPVVYKNTPDSATAGNFSRILVEGRKYEGNNPSELYGWLGITSFTGTTQNGSEMFVFQSIDVIPPNNDPSTKWIIKQYDYNSTTDQNGNTITQPPSGTAVLDTEEISVVFEGEVYIIEIESSNGTIFRPGFSTSTILSARVFKNGLEITNDLPSSLFRWRRVSYTPQPPPNDDATWNNDHLSGYKSITVNVDDVKARATFFCELLTS